MWFQTESSRLLWLKSLLQSYLSLKRFSQSSGPRGVGCDARGSHARLNRPPHAAESTKGALGGEKQRRENQRQGGKNKTKHLKAEKGRSARSETQRPPKRTTGTLPSPKATGCHHPAQARGWQRERSRSSGLRTRRRLEKRLSACSARSLPDTRGAARLPPVSAPPPLPLEGFDATLMAGGAEGGGETGVNFLSWQPLSEQEVCATRGKLRAIRSSVEGKQRKVLSRPSLPLPSPTHAPTHIGPVSSHPLSSAFTVRSRVGRCNPLPLPAIFRAKSCYPMERNVRTHPCDVVVAPGGAQARC